MKELSKEVLDQIGLQFVPVNMVTYAEGRDKDSNLNERRIFKRAVQTALTNPSIYSLAGLSPSLEWIPVSEERRIEKGMYLVYNEWGGMYVWDYDGQWKQYGTPHPITHYIPLPTPPKQP